MNTATEAAIDKLTPVVAPAVREALDGVTSYHQKRDIIEGVTKEVAAVVVNQANAEPWYQSRVTLGAILTAIAGVLGLLGYAFPTEAQGKVLDLIVALGPVIGAAVVLYGRWMAKKPLGA